MSEALEKLFQNPAVIANATAQDVAHQLMGGTTHSPVVEIGADMLATQPTPEVPGAEGSTEVLMPYLAVAIPFIVLWLLLVLIVVLRTRHNLLSNLDRSGARDRDQEEVPENETEEDWDARRLSQQKLILNKPIIGIE